MEFLRPILVKIVLICQQPAMTRPIWVKGVLSPVVGYWIGWLGADAVFWVCDVTKASYLIWANGRCSGSWGSPLHTWLAMVNWWFMQAVVPRASTIRPAACIFPVYCISISKTVTLTEIWSESLIVYTAKVHMCHFHGKYRAIADFKGMK